MPNYDFSGLSDFDFEDLVCGLASKKFGVDIKTYEKGRDGGIDGRYLPLSDLNDKEKGGEVQLNGPVIVQCKHYRASGYDKLRQNIKKSEVEKIQRDPPAHYILATSVGLTPMQEDELLKLIQPACPSVEVWGRLTINNLLASYRRLSNHISSCGLLVLQYFSES